MKSQAFLWLVRGMWQQKCLKNIIWCVSSVNLDFRNNFLGGWDSVKLFYRVWNKTVQFPEHIDGFLVCIWEARRWLCPCQNKVYLRFPSNAGQFLVNKNVTKNANQSF